MSLSVRRNKDGTLASRYWYADFTVKGRRRVISTGIPVIGKPGEKAYERSHGQAEGKHAQIVEEARRKGNAESLVERLVEMKTDNPVRSVALAALPDAWERIPRKRRPTAGFLRYGRSVLTRFASFVHERYPRVKEMADVTAPQMRTFMDAEEGRGITARTWNGSFGVLKNVFRRMEPSADAYKKYLSLAPAKTEDTVHRQPFSGEDIDAILDAARDDKLMRPLIVTAFCTAMRRGDCALLKWSSVNLDGSFITVKSSKTGETVEIPILPLLRDELANRGGKREGFVFPEAAALYKKDGSALNYRLQQVLAKAGFVDADTAERVKARDREPQLEVLPENELRKKGLAAIAAMQMIEAKRPRIKAVFNAYLDGKTVSQIEAELGVSKGTVSGHLNEIEKKIGAVVIRRSQSITPAVVRGLTHAENGTDQRLRRGSLRGWHSFRTTFITLALSAGLPMELVRRITGHTTVDVVLKHYFRPGREDFRRALESAMPRSFMESTRPRALPFAGSKGAILKYQADAAGPGEILGEAIKTMDAMTPQNWKKQRDVVEALVRQAKEWVDGRLVR